MLPDEVRLIFSSWHYTSILSTNKHSGKRLKHRIEPKQQRTHEVAPLKQQFPITVLFQSVPALHYGDFILRE